jgi:hypothetical protein
MVKGHHQTPISKLQLLVKLTSKISCKFANQLKVRTAQMAEFKQANYLQHQQCRCIQHDFRSNVLATVPPALQNTQEMD